MIPPRWSCGFLARNPRTSAGGVHASLVTTPVTPRPAATVVVVREAPDGPFEVMLLRRSAAMTFVAGAHVFPGGTLDEADAVAAAPEWRAALGGTSRFPHLDAAGEIACRVAAARELVEEAGVLLARRGGRFATASEAGAVRRRLEEGAPFAQAAREGGWRLALDALVPFAQIVTPRSEPRRFDTHFFLAELPAGAQAHAGAAESDELVWTTPARALADGLAGTLVLLPPTWATLMQLERLDSVAALLAWATSRSIERVEPSLTVDDGGRRISVPTAAGAFRFSFEEGRGWRPTG
jgi:8-oxo-dGTP pyrophosphatase MutT (NUDIX family)